jgi:hypothetical protein
MQYQAVQQRRVWITEIDRHFGDALTLVLFHLVGSVLYDRLAGLSRITGLVHTRPIMHLLGPYGHQYLVDAR